MLYWLTLFLCLFTRALKSRRNLLPENLALRHQLLVLNRTTKRRHLMPLDRALWVWLSQNWHAWKTHVLIVQPATVIRWHRNGFRLLWKWRSRRRKVGRKTIDPDTVSLIRQMSRANPSSTVEIRSPRFGG